MRFATHCSTDAAASLRSRGFDADGCRSILAAKLTGLRTDGLDSADEAAARSIAQASTPSPRRGWRSRMQASRLRPMATTASVWCSARGRQAASRRSSFSTPCSAAARRCAGAAVRQHGRQFGGRSRGTRVEAARAERHGEPQGSVRPRARSSTAVDLLREGRASALIARRRRRGVRDRSSRGTIASRVMSPDRGVLEPPARRSTAPLRFRDRARADSAWLGCGARCERRGRRHSRRRDVERGRSRERVARCPRAADPHDAAGASPTPC